MHLPRRMVRIRCHQGGFLRLGHLVAVACYFRGMYAVQLMAEPCPLVGIATLRTRRGSRKDKDYMYLHNYTHTHTRTHVHKSTQGQGVEIDEAVVMERGDLGGCGSGGRGVRAEG